MDIQDPSSLPDLLTVKETAVLLNRTPLTIKRMEAKGRIDCIRINARGDRRFRKQDILAYLERVREYESSQEEITEYE